MINFNFCNDEEYTLQNEAYRRQSMGFPYQPAYLEMYTTHDNYIQAISKEKHIIIP